MAETDIWAAWSSCPRMHEGRYWIDQDTGTLAELLRWEYETGATTRPLTARGSHLLRLWTRVKEYPSALFDHIAVEKMRRDRDKGKGL